jgi:UDP:flavonoid glycosyltransferase YjiC (YdhE family)
MRALISCLPSVGHFYAIAPLARAVEAAGHEVVFVSSESFGATVREAGFTAIAAGVDWLESEVEQGFPDLLRDPADAYTNRYFWPMVFTRAARKLLPELLGILSSRRPDVVLSEGLDLAAPLAAEALGIRHARWSIEAWRPQAMLARTMGPLWNQTRVELGLLPDPDLDRLCPDLYLDLYPPGLQRVPPHEIPRTAHALRPEPELPSAATPAWLAELRDQPTVYLTMGTIFNRAEGAFEMVLEALRDEPVNVIATVGANRDPGTLGPQPANVRIERYLPLGAVLAHSDAVVCHAPYNAVVSALRAGIPVLAIPFRADQLHNAFALAASGAGLRLDRAAATPGAIREATRCLLRDPLHRMNAQRLRQEMEALPPVARGVELLERLASPQPALAGARR